MVADDLKDAAKRIAFPDELVIPQGGYLETQLGKDGWPGFALGGDEELGIWTADGVLVAEVDWDEGQAGEGMSFARVPDAIGEFQTVRQPHTGCRKPDWQLTAGNAEGFTREIAIITAVPVAEKVKEAQNTSN